MAATATAGSLSGLRAIVGPDHARQAEPADAVGGVQASFVVEPASTEEAAGTLRYCSTNGLAVAVRGSGSKLSWGAPPESLDVVLSTSRMDALVEHAAGDLVVVAEPGYRLEDLQEALAGSGQMLALDPPEASATLGGIVAASASGPRRLRYGTARDLLIGITVALSDGTVARAGGRVVKNVAGYDLCKLFTGSFGTLGLIARLTFRLHPVPETRRTVEVAVATPEAALVAARLATSATLVPSAVELDWPSRDGSGMVKVLYEGIEPGVEAQASRARSLLSHPATQGIGTPNVSDAWPQPEAAADATSIKLAHPVSDLPVAVATAWEAADRHGLVASVAGHAATGVTFVRIANAPDAEAVVGVVADLRTFAANVGGSAVVLDAATDVRRAVDVWGANGDAIGLMRRVKERFDPTRTMSPGRFVGGI